MKYLISSAALAFVVALLIAVFYRPAPLEQQLVRLQVERLAPQYADELHGEPAAVQALLLMYADDPVLLAKARVALIRYPELARPIFALYGDTPAFQQILRAYGEDVLLPVHYFMGNEIFSLKLMRGLNESASSALETIRGLWSASQTNGDMNSSARPELETEPGVVPRSESNSATNPEPIVQSQADAASELQLGSEQQEATMQDESPSLSSEERGLYAIYFIQDEGYNFLGQFVATPDGEVAWIQTERVLEGINRFFASGIRGLETKLRTDDAVGMADVGWAALDVAVGVAAFKLLRVGKAAAVGGRTLTFSQRSAALGSGLWRGTVIGARLVKYGAPAVLAYMAVRHPSVINSMLGSAAEKLGLPTALVQVVGWTLLLLPVVMLLRFLIGPIAWLITGMLGLLRWGDRALRTNRAIES